MPLDPGVPQPVRLFDSSVLSGNGYKVRWMLHWLGCEVERVQLDIFGARETRTPDFLAKNPNGRIPVLELSDGSYLAESNAILCYLAADTPLWPRPRLVQARVLSWLFFEQYSHEPYLAVLRAWRQYTGLSDRSDREIAAKVEGSHAALSVLERALSQSDWLVAGELSVADVALYPYTRLAHEAELSLDAYPAVRAWLARFEACPGHLPLR